MPRSTLAIGVVLACVANPLAAFTALPRKVASPISYLNLFGNLGDAFKNDDGLGKQDNAGLKGVSVYLFACIIICYLYITILSFSSLFSRPGPKIQRRCHYQWETCKSGRWSKGQRCSSRCPRKDSLQLQAR
jgi:hypothetical protein